MLQSGPRCTIVIGRVGDVLTDSVRPVLFENGLSLGILILAKTECAKFRSRDQFH